MLNTINETFDLHKVDLRTYSPLALAFIGDSVFATVVKAVIIEKGNCSGNKLHHYSAHVVRAESQALMYDLWKETVTEEEAVILQRGHNAKSVNTAKNATVQDYRKATAVETLTGYLFLEGREERLCELIRLGMEAVYARDEENHR
ncbi:MAG: ribonuclease III [Lachnospiraceae bacterium]|nr:ribonuclease III [Lachnospiraceae bacterium]